MKIQNNNIFPSKIASFISLEKIKQKDYLELLDFGISPAVIGDKIYPKLFHKLAGVYRGNNVF